MVKRLLPLLYAGTFAFAVFALSPIPEKIKESSGKRRYNDYFLFKEKVDSLKNVYNTVSISISDSLAKDYQFKLDSLKSEYKK